MILQKGDKRREKYFKSGSVLKTIRGTGGWAKGCMAGGAALAVSGLICAVPLILDDMARAGVFICGFFGLPGILLILMGFAFQRKRVNNYLKYYQKENGLSREEILQVERELMEPDMIMIGNVPGEKRQGVSERKPQIAFMVTKNYLVAPFIMGKSYVRQISDMVLMAYSMELSGLNGHTDGLIFFSKQDKDVHKNIAFTRDVCREIIEILKERQPNLITSQRFEYNGKKYDALCDGAEMIREVSG